MRKLRDSIKAGIRFMHAHEGGLRSKTIRSGLWVGASSAATTLLSLVRSIILARLLTPEIFGLMNLALVFIRGVETFTRTGFAAALIQRQHDFETARDTAFTLLAVRGIILTLVVYLAAPLVGAYYENETQTTLVGILAFAFLISGFENINIVAHQRDLNFKKVVYHELGVALLGFVVVVICAYYMRSVWALAIGYLTTAVTSLVLSYIVFPGRPRFHVDMKAARELFQYGKFISAAAIVIFIATEIDNLVIGKVLGLTALGYYVLAFTLANLPTTHFSKVISRVMFPAYSKLQNDVVGLQEAYLRVLRIVTTFSIPATVGMMILAPEIIRVVYGNQWLDSVTVLQILAIFGCVRAVSSINGYIYNAIGKPDITFYLTISRFIAIAVMIYPSVKLYGIEGAAVAVTLPIALEFVIGVGIFSRKIALDMKRVFIPLVRILALSGIMAAVVWYARVMIGSTGIWQLATLILLGAVTFGVLNQKDIREQFGWLRSRKAA